MPGPVRALLTRFGHAGRRRTRTCCAGCSPTSSSRCWRRWSTTARCRRPNPIRPTPPTGATTCAGWPTGRHRPGHRPAGARLHRRRPPAALLYLLLRHAVLLGWDDAARALAAAAGMPGAASPADPAFVHVRIPRPASPSESRFRLLYSPDPAVTGDPNQLLVDFSRRVLNRPGPTAPRSPSRSRRWGVLADLPTARLERVLAEHLDLATYRLDAWRLGLATERLPSCASAPTAPPARPDCTSARTAGWRTCGRAPAAEPVTLTGPLATVFAGGSTPLLHDPANEGFVHAPVPGHARTAAVLRAGYLANADAGQPRHVRGQPQLRPGPRRTVHPGRDAAGPVARRAARLPVRARPARPARRGRGGRVHRRAAAEVPAAGRQDRQTAGPSPRQGPGSEQVEARNVIDGLALVRHVTRNGVSRTYPFGIDGAAEATPAQKPPRSPEATGCSTSTTRSPTSPSPRAPTRPSPATPSARRRPSTPTPRTAAARPGGHPRPRAAAPR
jgi:hypothetical protein